MPNNIESRFVDPVLLHQAEQVCKMRLKNDPANRDVVRSLAEVHRKVGNLPEAAAAYDRLVCLDPQDHEAGYLQAVFGGTEWPAAPRGIRAAPFLLLKDFLPPEIHDSLLPFFVSVQRNFVPALVGDNIYRPEFRAALDYRHPWEARQQFWERLASILPSAVSRLRLPPFEIDGIEICVRAYQDGHFFKVHKDVRSGSVRANRTLAFVYFFHKLPRPYSGGELLLFDSDTDGDEKYTTSGFTRVVPEDNSIIIFPGNFYHCVVPVHCPSKEFSDSRFVINGHVNKRPDPDPVAEENSGVGQTSEKYCLQAGVPHLPTI